jgi:hypothetical protein
MIVIEFTDQVLINDFASIFYNVTAYFSIGFGVINLLGSHK